MSLPASSAGGAGRMVASIAAMAMAPPRGCCSAWALTGGQWRSTEIAWVSNPSPKKCRMMEDNLSLQIQIWHDLIDNEIWYWFSYKEVWGCAEILIVPCADCGMGHSLRQTFGTQCFVGYWIGLHHRLLLNNTECILGCSTGNHCVRICGL